MWRARACSRQVDDAGAVCQPGPLTPQWKVRMRCRLLCCFPQPHAASGLQEAHAYFRAVRASGEVSPRARALTALLVALNPADYTAWAWRYRCVAAAAAEEEAAAAETNAPGAAASSAGAWSGCSADESQRRAFLLCTVLTSLRAVIAAELRYTERLAERSAKNYQLWCVPASQPRAAASALCTYQPVRRNHRRLVAALGVARAGAPAVAARELAFTSAALGDDAKNYHAWAHRGWAVALGQLWAAELRATDALLRDDPRNNSAWNARLGALTRRGGEGEPHTLDGAAAEAEVARAGEALRDAPRDEAAWAYVRGVLRAAPASCNAAAAAGALAAAHASAGCPHATAFLADEALARSAAARAAGDEHAAAAEAAAARAAFASLQRADPVRAHYWACRCAAIAA